MRRLLISALLMLAGSAAMAQTNMAQTKEPIALRDIGSFHLGGRYVDISGKPTREVSIGGATQTLTRTALISSSRCTCNICCRRTARARCRS
jgi:hypothetical protein